MVVDRKMVAASMPRWGFEGISPRMCTRVTTIQDPAALALLITSGGDGTKDGPMRSGPATLPTCAPSRDGSTWPWAVTATPGACWAGRRTGTRAPASWAWPLRMAHTLRGTVPEDLVFHADRRVQCTSQMLFGTCDELGVRQSAGRTGCVETT